MTRRKSLEKQRGPSTAGEPAVKGPQPATKTSRAVAPNGELVVVGAPERYIRGRVHANLHKPTPVACGDPRSLCDISNHWVAKQARRSDTACCASP